MTSAIANILVVDDKPENLFAMEKLLAPLNVQVYTALSGREALALILRHTFALILLDVQMPGMDGYETANLIRDHRATKLVPIIFVTAIHKEETQVLKGYEAGAVDYIFKPIDIDVFTSKIKIFLQLDRQKQELHATLSELSAAKDNLESINRQLNLEIADRVKAEDQLAHLAKHDTLTGLANRLMFDEHLQGASHRALRHNRPMAMMMIDLDHFKQVNDTLGHDIGDQLLIETAQRMKDCIREVDTLARVGGDEFYIILEELDSVEAVATVAQRIINILRKPFTLAGQEVLIGSSIGICLFPTDVRTIDGLLKNADVAMYQAKHKGRNNYQFFTKEMDSLVRDKMILVGDLHTSLQNREFFLLYQPQLEIQSNRIIGVEALLRWRHPSKGIITPDVFLPLLEKNRLINQVSEWVIDEACRQNVAWQEKGLPPMNMAVNFSAQQFLLPQLAEQVEAIVTATGMALSQLEVDITENLLAQKNGYVAPILKRLKCLGVSIALDNFGTGVSSLKCLKEFPIDIIKIDKLFIKGILADSNDSALICAIIAMANGLMRKGLMAEGVETLEELSFLKTKSCQYYQGYLFREPVSAAEIETMLREQQRGVGWVARPFQAAGK